jgi:beta-phosphoglucomutase
LVLFKVEINGFNQHDIIKNGNRFLIGNGYLGYRGTLEEFTKDQMVALNMAGLFDQNGNHPRESVNAFNPFFTYLKVGGTTLNPLFIAPLRHTQTLDMEMGIHRRKTTFSVEGTEITVESERFPGQTDLHILVMKYSFSVDQPIEVDLLTGIDTAVYDMNGPHLENYSYKDFTGAYTVCGLTVDKHGKVAVSEVVKNGFEGECETLLINGMAMHRYRVQAVPGELYTIWKYAGVDHTWGDSEDRARNAAIKASEAGYEALYLDNQAFWKHKWTFSDIEIKGDDELQLAIRNSIYHMIIVRPFSEYRGIPCRGLSGQMYKGAVTSETELFLLPFYLNTDLDAARKIIMYRIHTLEGAMRKAKSYGFQGAFYPIESQDTGDEVSSDFNLVDVDTGTPIRTPFNQKRIHVSADVVYAIDRYVEQTNDHSVLASGGFRMIMECARFYQSFVTYDPEKAKYVVKDVIGPDEYHEGVNNSAFTNRMIQFTFETMIKMLKWLRAVDYPLACQIIEENDYDKDIDAIKVILKALYVPQPAEDGVIEEFDGYRQLENIEVSKVKKRIKHPSEYWGGPNGIATPTQVIRQADVATMLVLFRQSYSKRIKLTNLRYYEAKTDHYNSTFSTSMYAILAAETGDIGYVMETLRKTASVDLSGESKMYAGGVFVGGTHPASNGGVYMTTVYGLCGLRHLRGILGGTCRLPEYLEEVRFKCMETGKIANVVVRQTGVRITWEKRQNIDAVILDLDGVVVNTERYHFLAWKKIADRENVPFDPAFNARLRGLSRMETLDAILQKAGRKYTQAEKNNMAAFKNAEYLSLLDDISEKDILPGVPVVLAFLKSKKIKVALTSGSKNAKKILEKTRLASHFEILVDGNEVSSPKPNPEIFIKAAAKLGINPENCVVVDDSTAGIQAAKAASMFAAATAEAKDNPMCDWILKDLSELIHFL